MKHGDFPVRKLLNDQRVIIRTWAGSNRLISEPRTLLSCEVKAEGHRDSIGMAQIM